LKELLAIIRGLLEGLDLRRRWIAVVGLLLVLVLAIAVIEAWTGWNYYSNLQKKADLLLQLQSLVEGGIESNERLSPIYDQLAEELEDRSTPQVGFPAVRFQTSESFWKFIWGGSFWFLFAVSAIFGTFGDENRIAGTIILLVIGVVSGIIATWIPTILNPWVNYIGFPLLQIILIFIIAARSRRKTE